MSDTITPLDNKIITLDEVNHAIDRVDAARFVRSSLITAAVVPAATAGIGAALSASSIHYANTVFIVAGIIALLSITFLLAAAQVISMFSIPVNVGKQLRKVNELLQIEPSMLNEIEPRKDVYKSLRIGGELSEKDFLQYRIRYYDSKPPGNFSDDVKMILSDLELEVIEMEKNNCDDYFNGKIEYRPSYDECVKEIKRIKIEYADHLFDLNSILLDNPLDDVTIPEVGAFYEAMEKVDSLDSQVCTQTYRQMVRDFRMAWNRVKALPVASGS